MQEELLGRIVIGPEDADAAVIWMHGLGASGDDFVPVVPELGLPETARVRFVFPHAPIRPVTINMGMEMRAWYDIVSLDFGSRDQDGKGIDESVAHVEALIAAELAAGVAPERIVLAGFSQGGAIALEAASQHEGPLAGIVALSCYLLRPEGIAGNARFSGMKVFVGHGTQDPMVPFAAGEQSQSMLAEAGAEVVWRSYPMPHSVVMEEIEDIGGFLREVLAL